MAQTLLVADDSKTMRHAITLAFKGSPFQVVTVGSGAEALQAAYEHRPAIILLDYHLPDRDGMDVCRAIKGDPSLKSIPVLMMGGGYHPFDEAEARAQGSDDVIRKPFKTDLVHEKVKALTGAQPEAAARASVPTPPAVAKAPSPFGNPALKPTAEAPRVQNTAMGLPASGGGSRLPSPPTSPNAARYGSRLPAPPSVPAGSKLPSRYPAPPSPRSQPIAPPSPPATVAPTPSPMAAAPPRGVATPMPSVPTPAPMAAPTPVPAPAPVAAPLPDGVVAVGGGVTIDREEIRRLVREEVQAAVRAEMLVMVKSVLGDLFKEKMLPKLLSYGQERVEAIVARDLQSIMERRVEEELARLTEG